MKIKYLSVTYGLHFVRLRRIQLHGSGTFKIKVVTLLQHVRNRLPNDVASHPTTTVSSSTPPLYPL